MTRDDMRRIAERYDTRVARAMMRALGEAPPKQGRGDRRRKRGGRVRSDGEAQWRG